MGAAGVGAAGAHHVCLLCMLARSSKGSRRYERTDSHNLDCCMRAEPTGFLSLLGPAGLTSGALAPVLGGNKSRLRPMPRGEHAEKAVSTGMPACHSACLFACHDGCTVAPCSQPLHATLTPPPTPPPPVTPTCFSSILQGLLSDTLTNGVQGEDDAIVDALLVLNPPHKRGATSAGALSSCVCLNVTVCLAVGTRPRTECA